MTISILNFAITIFSLFRLISAAKTPTGPISPNTFSFPTPITQMDFLVTPDDFDKDEDVCYLVKQLHRPQSIEKFYLTAAQIYADLPAMYQEIQTNLETAKQFLSIMQRLTAASLTEPLTVTNLIFAAAKHLRPIFTTHKSQPLEEIFATISELEKDTSHKMIRLMTNFFTSFTLREVSQLQDLINLVSLATINTNSDEIIDNEVNNGSTLKNKKNYNKKNTSINNKKPKSGKLDISRTPLEPFAERIRITIANAIAKMLILLDLFVTDESVAKRSLNLIRRLWNLHLRRLAIRENVPFEELDIKWYDPILYRKAAINFSFDDWGPNSVSPEAMAALRNAAGLAEKLDKAAQTHRLSSKKLSLSLRIALFLFCFALLTIIATFAFFFFKRRRELAAAAQIDLTSLESQSISEIVSKLERNI